MKMDPCKVRAAEHVSSACLVDGHRSTSSVVSGVMPPRVRRMLGWYSPGAAHAPRTNVDNAKKRRI